MKIMRRMMAVGFLALLGLSACGSDRTLDEYKNHKVMQELDKFRGVSGNYSGVVTARSDGRILGAMNVNLSADTQTVGSGGERRAVLSAQVEFTDATSTKTVAVTDGFYDALTKAFQFGVSIENVSGQTFLLSFSGQLTADAMTGKVEVTGFRDYGGVYALSRNRSLPQLDLPADDVERMQRMLSTTFRGEMPFYMDRRMTPVTLLLQPAVKNTDQEFLDVFLPVKSVAFTVDVDGGTLRFTFLNGEWDLRTGTLKGSVSGTSSGMSYRITVDCREIPVSSAEFGWDCLWRPATTDAVPFKATAPIPQGPSGKKEEIR